MESCANVKRNRVVSIVTNDNSCKGFPLPIGIPSTTQEGTANMTCYKGAHTHARLQDPRYPSQ
ncbi:hypothetical protein B0F90DRAFT_1764129 [Multifurca ochricompacta]|uniref:Uncharacterized protein n=1 Tax=Multifurca ochricompacta TaxID=376703 RepID=A0AAD4QJZ4_9AGAM|nr:hypothetical protein B0F90DRAFT_1764129 [Multifurca ochricompacta]